MQAACPHTGTNAPPGMQEHVSTSRTPNTDSARAFMTAADFDSRRATRLSQMKRRANGLLVFAALVFVATHIWGRDEVSWGFVRAAAEAGMVGGVADWFAVTAIFRHPLGIPIP